MDSSEDKRQFAWQPLTPRGVAAFANASLARLLAAQLVVACLSAATFLWFLSHCWSPIIRQAIEQLPETGEISTGVLQWPTNSPVRLAENHFLAITVDTTNSGLARSPAQLSLEFGRTGARLYSLLGFMDLRYPPLGSVAFNRLELVPWWGAWNPVFLALAGGVWILGLLVGWWVLAWVYCLPVWIVGFFFDRNLTLKSSRRIAAAALLPAALFLSLCVVFYGLAYLDLIRLALAWAVHLVIGWIYVGLGIFCVPRASVAARLANNPFTTAPNSPDAVSGNGHDAKGSDNPFTSSNGNTGESRSDSSTPQIEKDPKQD